MKDIKFIASADHTNKPKKGMRNIGIIINPLGVII